MSSLEKCLFKSSAHFLIEFLACLMRGCMSCLYILKVNHFWLLCFQIISLNPVGCLFALFMVSFALQKLLNLIRSHLFLLLFSLL